MLTKNAIGNLINRYKAVLGKCRLMNVFGSLAVAGMLVVGAAGIADAGVLSHYSGTANAYAGMIASGASGGDVPATNIKAYLTISGNVSTIDSLVTFAGVKVSSGTFEINAGDGSGWRDAGLYGYGLSNSGGADRYVGTSIEGGQITIKVGGITGGFGTYDDTGDIESNLKTLGDVIDKVTSKQSFVIKNGAKIILAGDKAFESGDAVIFSSVTPQPQNFGTYMLEANERLSINLRIENGAEISVSGGKDGHIVSAQAQRTPGDRNSSIGLTTVDNATIKVENEGKLYYWNGIGDTTGEEKVSETLSAISEFKFVNGAKLEIGTGSSLNMGKLTKLNLTETSAALNNQGTIVVDAGTDYVISKATPSGGAVTVKPSGSNFDAGRHIINADEVTETTLTNEGVVNIGDSKAGKLNIATGLLNSGDGVVNIGKASGVTGELVLKDGSTSTNAGSIVIDATGTLTVEKDAKLTQVAGGTGSKITANPKSTLDIKGTVAALDLQIDGATVTIDGGTGTDWRAASLGGYAANSGDTGAAAAPTTVKNSTVSVKNGVLWGGGNGSITSGGDLNLSGSQITLEGADQATAGVIMANRGKILVKDGATVSVASGKHGILMGDSEIGGTAEKPGTISVEDGGTLHLTAQFVDTGSASTNKQPTSLADSGLDGDNALASGDHVIGAGGKLELKGATSKVQLHKNAVLNVSGGLVSNAGELIIGADGLVQINASAEDGTKGLVNTGTVTAKSGSSFGKLQYSTDAILGGKVVLEDSAANEDGQLIVDAGKKVTLTGSLTAGDDSINLSGDGSTLILKAAAPKTDGTADFTIKGIAAPSVNGVGTVQVEAGTADFAGGNNYSSSDANKTVALKVVGGTANVKGGSTNFGGASEVTGGELNIVPTDSSNKDVTFGSTLTIGGTAADAATATANVKSGAELTVTSASTINAKGVLNVESTGKATYTGGVTNAGQINLKGDNSQLLLSGGSTNNGAISLADGSKLTVKDAKLTSAGAKSTISNAGEIVVNGTASSELELGNGYTGNGKITVGSGKLTIVGDNVTNSGQITVASTGTLTVNSGAKLTNGKGLDIFGTGTITGELVNNAGQKLNISGGTTTVTGTLTNAGTVNVVNGTTSPAALVLSTSKLANSGTINIGEGTTAGAASISVGADVVNAGTINVGANGALTIEGTLTAGNLTTEKPATSGASGGVLKVTTGKLVVDKTLTNAGTIDLTTANGKAEVNGTLSNGGTLVVSNGELKVNTGGILDLLTGSKLANSSGKVGVADGGMIKAADGVLLNASGNGAADGVGTIATTGSGVVKIDSAVKFSDIKDIKAALITGTGQLAFADIDYSGASGVSGGTVSADKAAETGAVLNGMDVAANPSDKTGTTASIGGFGADSVQVNNAAESGVQVTVDSKGLTLLGDESGTLISATDASGSEVPIKSIAVDGSLNLGSQAVTTDGGALPTDTNVKLSGTGSLNAFGNDDGKEVTYTVNGNVTGTGDVTAGAGGTLTVNGLLGATGAGATPLDTVLARQGSTIQTAGEGNGINAHAVEAGPSGKVLTPAGGNIDAGTVTAGEGGTVAAGAGANVNAGNLVLTGGTVQAGNDVAIGTATKGSPATNLSGAIVAETGSITNKNADITVEPGKTLTLSAGQDVNIGSGEIKATVVEATAGAITAKGGITADKGVTAATGIDAGKNAVSAVTYELNADGSRYVDPTTGKNVELARGDVKTTGAGDIVAGDIKAQSVTAASGSIASTGDINARGEVAATGTGEGVIASVAANNIKAATVKAGNDVNVGTLNAVGQRVGGTLETVMRDGNGKTVSVGDVQAGGDISVKSGNIIARALDAAGKDVVGNVQAGGNIEVGNIAAGNVTAQKGSVTAGVGTIDLGGGVTYRTGGSINVTGEVKAATDDATATPANITAGTILADTVTAEQGQIVMIDSRVTAGGSTTTAGGSLAATKVTTQAIVPYVDALGNVDLPGNVKVGDEDKAHGSLILTDDQTKSVVNSLTLENATGQVQDLDAAESIALTDGSTLTANNLVVTGGTGKAVTVGATDDTDGSTLTAKSLQLNGAMLVTDPAFSVKNPHNATRVAVLEMGDSTLVDGALLIDGSVGVGRNSQVTIGTDNPNWLDTQVRQATGGAGLTQTGITAAFGITRPAVLRSGASLVVDGARVNQKADGKTVTARTSMLDVLTAAKSSTVTFAPNSLFVVQAEAALDPNGALSAQTATQANLFNNAKLRLVDAVPGHTYQVLGTNMVPAAQSGYNDKAAPVATTAEASTAWVGDNLSSDSRLVKLNPVYSADGYRDMRLVDATLNPAALALPGLHESTAAMLNSMALSGLIGQKHTTSGFGGVMFLNRAISTVGYMHNSPASEVGKTIQSVANAAVTAAPAAALSASNAASSVVAERTSIANPAGSAMQVMLSDGSILSGAAAGENRQGMGLWVMPMYQHNEIDGGSATGGSSDFSSDLGGVVLGADYTFGNIRAGASFNVGAGSGDADGDFNGTNTDFDFWGLGLYAGWSNNKLGFTADLSYSRTSSDLDQSLPFTLQMGDLSGDVDAWAVSLGLRGEYKINVGGVDIVPHAGIRYTHMKTDSYTLRAGNVDVVNGDSISQDVWTLPIGVAVSKDIALGSGEWWLRPSLDLAIIPAFGDTDADGSVTFTGVAQAADVSSEVVDDFTGMAQIGVDLGNDNLSFGLKYNFQAGDKTTQHSVFGTLRYQF